jgi:hypothetical protein
VDPHTFEGMIRKLSATLSRRSLVGGSLGASVLAAVGLGEETVAKKNRATAEACIPTGKRCPSPKPRGRKGRGGKGNKGRRAKKLTCDQCCQRRVIQDSKGQNICHCAPEDQPCTETRECCDGRCLSGKCRLCQAAGETCDHNDDGPFCCSDLELRCNQPGTGAGTCVRCVADGATCDPTNDVCCNFNCSSRRTLAEVPCLPSA